MNRLYPVLVVLTFLAVSFAFWKQKVAFLEQVRCSEKGYLTIKGRVVSDPIPISKYVDIESNGYKVKVFFRRSVPRWRYGDVVEVSGIAFVPYAYKNPGSFNIVDQMNRQGIAYFLKVRRWQIVGKGKGLLPLLHSFRMKLFVFSQKLNKPLRSFIPAVILGVKEPMGRYSRAFYALGLGHILAISGLHLGIFVAVFYFIFLWLLRVVNLFYQFPYLLLPRRAAHVLVLLLLPFILIITGNHLSTQRAAFMYLCYVFFGVFLERRVGLLQTLLLALAIFAMIKPQQIATPGFQYTFLAVFLLGVLDEKFWEASRWVKLSLASVVLPVALLPISAYHFHLIYPLGSLFNTFLLPVFSALIALVAVLFPLAFVLNVPKLVGLLNPFVKVLFKLVLLFSELPGVIFNASRLDFAIALFLSVFVLHVFVRNRVCLVLLCGLLLFLVFTYWDIKRDRVVFFDMGKAGEASLVVRNGEFLLVNAGGKGREGAEALFQTLIWEGANRIDKIVCTSKGREATSYIDYFMRRFPGAILEGCDGLWEGKCRKFEVEGVDFVCFKRECRANVCKVLKGPVIYKGKDFYPYNTGAVKIYLEGLL
ncbi:hypothetical protein TST_0353 [Thermosulfidibacter takaii ABI70S6]|uniref:ComEC/Rec2-related protein domain-containing protein n=1 Tax=Thermosulfidibacter takaii (strain DSM 17441 / JCM 13301 / NBRC 103674 / ABI70S6) TaxID=1298851 RepID=A0A0S3QS71_THET7|nr:ComEC/Rec2 family competence protein [Thermosulfidibacter takaii]BAT71161.1 hypothetical protein TST_0353 [Thermosulfidibacter takaii ABI70S6]